MFGFKKGKSDQANDQNAVPPAGEEASRDTADDASAATPQDPTTVTSAEPSPEQQPPKKAGLFARLAKGLKRTRSGFTEGVTSLVMGKKAIDDEVLEEIEALLLSADVGIEATESIIDDLTARLKRKQLNDTEALFQALTEDMSKILEPVSQPLTIPASDKPFVILMVGINGAGKTTTIGKLAKRFQGDGHSVMLAAGDTFRAAAVEQLQEWGKRNDIPVIAQQTGADSASVIYDAVQAAHARKINVLIADTAGRLHTQANLMEELKKVRRVITKLDAEAPHEVMIVLDASIGQNAVMQAKQFQEAVGVSGVTLTKLDGTAKGGVIFAIARQLGIPIRYIGIGEGIDDLRDFNAGDFVNALLQHDTSTTADSGGS
ncbi:MAG: signal recognition particle-docking protein FtsY [Gammaproteobacteria bacterium]|jgi:fused signal recognition particle receptor